MPAQADLSKVSIIIPTYNQSRLLCLAVESVLAQTYPAVELIVVDDGSTDDTPTAMQRYAGRITYIRQSNQGGDAAVSAGMRVASGEYLGVLNHDDLFMPTKIEKQVRILDTRPDVALCHCGYTYIDEKGDLLQNYTLLPDADVLKELIMTNFIWSGGPLLRRECVEDVGPGDDDLWCSDWDMWLRIALAGYGFYCVQEPLGAYRILPTSEMSNVARLERGSIALLDKVYRTSGLPADVLAIRDKAYGAMRFRVACWYYAAGLWDDARRNLSAAMDLSVFPSSDTLGFTQALVTEALGFRMRAPVAFVENVFDHLPSNAEHLTRCRMQALAQVHTGLALRLYAGGRTQDAKHQLASAIGVYPMMVGEAGAFAALLSQEAMKLPVRDPVGYVDTVMSNLPAQARPLAQFRSRVLADVSIACAFQDYGAGRYALAARRVAAGVWRRPSWLGDKGVPAIFVKSLAAML